MPQNVAEQIVAQLIDAGVRRIYGIVGDSLNPIVDAVRRSGGSAEGGIDWIHVRHEEAAAFAAAADAELTGQLAVCAGSCGPGNLHLINGLYDAQRSGVPVLAIASHIPSVQIGSGYFQETHPERLFTECSDYCEMILTPEQSPRVVNSAIRHATAGGSVSVLVLPGDLAEKHASGPFPPFVPARPGRLAPDAESVDDLAAAIDRAHKVALFVGEGARDARDQVIAFAEHLRAPMGHSLRGKQWIQYDNPYDVGMSGLLGYGAIDHAMHEADLLLLLGTDFPYDQFLPDGAKTTIAQVDVDAQRLGRRAGVTHPIHGDVGLTLAALREKTTAKTDGSFLEHTQKRYRAAMTDAVATYTDSDAQPIHPERAMTVIDRAAAPDAVFTADTGMGNVWQARYVTPSPGRRLLASWRHGSMANALPHAFGAQLAYPDRQVIAIAGDGGLSMLLGELITVAAYRLPLTVFVFNNSTLGMVKAEMLVAGFPDFGVDVPMVDFAAVGSALGFRSQRVTDPGELDAAVAAALAHDGPSLVDIVTDPDALSMPAAITGEQVAGFGMSMAKMVLGAKDSGGIGAVLETARSNIKHLRSL
ncbi:thiamine pyrophosphate-dependent enzyme [Microbacterium oleivorans]|uniref:Ubiquinone-dependent pyruvate dehydrogenase n=1 Tax=Microbacterium oleivorans TaxID=273677 RepID=A0A7D5ERI0_9MICO|nr:thiamine pyrophosphate-dependent enzyme [Microbacterium oleivorans]QLD11105.1 ubiquinone-dependent pyruvate dehydrogenase [Microbacterium oleivorans]